MHISKVALGHTPCADRESQAVRLLAELKRRNVIRMAADVSPSASVVSQAAKWMDHLTQELAP